MLTKDRLFYSLYWPSATCVHMRKWVQIHMMSQFQNGSSYGIVYLAGDNMVFALGQLKVTDQQILYLSQNEGHVWWHVYLKIVSVSGSINLTVNVFELNDTDFCCCSV
jgi:hypothetical protein